MRKYFSTLAVLAVLIYGLAAVFTAEQFQPGVRGLARVLVIHKMAPSWAQPAHFHWTVQGKPQAATPAKIDAYLADAKKTSEFDFWTQREVYFSPVILADLWLYALPWLSLWASFKLLNAWLTIRRLSRP
ncbi:hypothetical protein THIX_60989 [Thiomonas sp. X19]|uniref:hypothetical protein n=1 Tax=Thiomonas sp. X19 TaxID=1050370 RepID=UPI000B6BA5BD|nr:hypothetical protein [Thiomonas sp. X19]SCC94931.1 hypothetical protein THIX_60989 [Thiomonas sp. X19]